MWSEEAINCQAISILDGDKMHFSANFACMLSFHVLMYAIPKEVLKMCPFFWSRKGALTNELKNYILALLVDSPHLVFTVPTQGMELYCSQCFTLQHPTESQYSTVFLHVKLTSSSSTIPRHGQTEIGLHSLTATFFSTAAFVERL